MKKGDIILIIIAVLALTAAVLFVFLRSKSGYCAVYDDGKLLARYPMNKDDEIVIRTGDGHYNILVIEDGEAYVSEADCPNQICVNARPVSKTGDSILCLPHKISIILEQ